MTNDTPQPDIAKIRQLLLEAFTPEDLRRFCHDRPDFRIATKRFGSGHGHDDMADELITYCETFLLFPELLAELKQHNPRQYARFFGPESSEEEPAPPAPELLTISRPISLHLVRIPAGEFQMGSEMARNKHAQEDELPPHPVDVPQFHIGRYPVTNRQYQAFVQAAGRQAPRHWKAGEIPWPKDNHPVVMVSWEDAVAFCEWLSRETKQPFRLPNEAEREKAARGTDGRIYPWGDDPPDKERCNFGRYVGDTTTIGRYSPQGDSPYGCADMAGNVWEWCQSLYEPYPYQADNGREELQAQGRRVLRGGAFIDSEWFVRCAFRFRDDPNMWNNKVGFRVAVAPGPSGP
jgi:formylglycine-generating enzyme required for sulfatase activity